MTSKILAKLSTDGRVVADLLVIDTTVTPGIPGKDVPEDFSADVTSIAGVARGWLKSGATFVAPAVVAPTQAQLAAALLAAALSTSNAITKAIASSDAHLAGYQSFANMARAAIAGGASNGVPTIASDLAAVTAAAGALKITPAAFSTLVLAMDAASGQNLAILLTLEAAVAGAASAADLASALSAYQTSVADVVAQLVSAGLTITPPNAISILGINA